MHSVKVHGPVCLRVFLTSFYSFLLLLIASSITPLELHYVIGKHTLVEIYFMPDVSEDSVLAPCLFLSPAPIWSGGRGKKEKIKMALEEG